MKRLIIAITALAAACSPDIEKALPAWSNYTIDKVECTAPSQVFAADGKDQLDLQVRIYSKAGTYTDNYGGTQTRYVEVPRDRWRGHEIKFFVNGAEVTPPYTTTTAGTIECYTTVDGVRSSLSPAALAALFPVRNPDAPFTDPAPAAPADEANFIATAETPVAMQARKIPVIFHIIDSDQNRQNGQILSSSSVYAVIAKWNAAFADANIEFVPALKNAVNARLSEPGINRQYPTSTVWTDMTAPSAFEANIWGVYKYNDSKGSRTDLVMNNATVFNYIHNNGMLVSKYPNSSYYYTMARYLNVWVLCDEINMSSATFANAASQYLPSVFPDGVWNDTDLPLPIDVTTKMRPLDTKNMGYWNANPGDARIVKVGQTAPTFTTAQATRTLRQAGLSFKKSDMANIGTAQSTEVVAAMGSFLGLVPNYPVYATENSPGGAWQDDFCSDTPAYSLWFASPQFRGMELAASGSNRVKYTCQPPYSVYTSSNVMEYGSNQTRLTPQQLKRVEWVLNNAPGRAMWKNLTAITE